MMSHKVIAVDGPAGSGKSTTARQVAEKLGFIYLDTGAMYRSVTLLALREGISPSDAEALQQLAEESEIEFSLEGGEQRTIVNGEDVSENIRSPEVTTAVSEVSAHSGVRKVMVERQQQYATKFDLVAEGRDTTSVVFQHAFLKVYLVADVVERAKRRVRDFARLGRKTSIEEQVKDIERRDEYDSSRNVSPLTMTTDSLLVDTTDLTVDQQVDRIIELFREKLES
jgi:cytidylate kinase